MKPTSGSRISTRSAPLQSCCLPIGVGVGLKGQHYKTVLARSPAVGFFEIHAENYMGAGGPPHHYLSRIREAYPLSVHGVGLSIGAEANIDEAHLDRLAALLQRYQPASFSEHLAWSSHGGTYFNDLLPVPYDQKTLLRVCTHIDQVQERLQRRMLLENPATYVEFADNTLSEPGFIAEVLRRTGCGLLLDVTNVFVSCTNHHKNPRAYIDALPLSQVGEIHLAGFTTDRDAAGAPLLIDAHGSPIADPVWDLYRYALERSGPVATLIEWDNDVPSFERLIEEAQRARQCLIPTAGGRGRLRMTGQAEFAVALLDAERPCPAGLTAWNGSDPGKRFAVYRNNVVTSLMAALTDSFPVTRELVGDAFFRAMAHAFIASTPPRSPILAVYGLAFPAFIDHFGPADSVPYLADIARLEAHRVSAYHAADAQPLAEEGFRRALAHADALPAARLRLHPTAAVQRSAYAVFSLWAAHQGALDIGTVDPYRAEEVLIVRPHLEVLATLLRPGAGRFLQQLGDGVPFGESALTASGEEPGFDLGSTLADLIGAGVVIAIDFEKEMLS